MGTAVALSALLVATAAFVVIVPTLGWASDYAMRMVSDGRAIQGETASVAVLLTEHDIPIPGANVSLTYWDPTDDTIYEIPLRDDGGSGDSVAGDGIYGGQVRFEHTGTVSFVALAGVGADYLVVTGDYTTLASREDGSSTCAQVLAGVPDQVVASIIDRDTTFLQRCLSDSGP